MRTFLPASDALHTNQNLPLRHLMPTVNVVLQCDESIQLFPISITVRRLAQDFFIAVLLYHEVATVVPFWEYRSDERGILQRRGARLRAGDVWCPN